MVEHDKELRHSQTIIRELLESLIKQVDVPLRISNIEGDALFLYAIKSGDDDVWQRRGTNLVTRLMGLFQAFAQRLVEIGAYSVCNCGACRVVGNLKLKIIAHSGDAMFSHVGEYPTLSGVDVITVHRLAKNSVEQDQYMLMTESAYKDLGRPGGSDIEEGTEVTDTGTFKTFLFVPSVEIRDDAEFIRSHFSNDNAAVQILRDEVAREYTDVANDPSRGYHFNTGYKGLETNGYADELTTDIPPKTIESFAGTGNPFSMGMPADGEYVVDIGSGAGMDAMIAAKAVGPAGHVIGVDMTEAMLDKAREAAKAMHYDQLEFRHGYIESLPVPDGWADLIISNGVLNLSPDKLLAYGEIYRALRSGGRMQIADITVQRPVTEDAKKNIDLWTN